MLIYVCSSFHYWPRQLFCIFQGFDIKDGGGILLISSMVKEMLNMECAVLMGANIANEVASEQYCEATIGW